MRMSATPHKRLLRAFIILSFCLLPCSCRQSVETEDTGKITLAEGKLTVLTRNVPTVYYEGPEGKIGFEHDLVKEFADHLGYDIEFKVLDGVKEIFDTMDNGMADLAAAGITRTKMRETAYLFGPDYYEVEQQVICHRNGLYPRTLKDLPDFEIVVMADSSYVERLLELKKDLPDLRWETTDIYNTEQLLEKVWKKEFSCTVSDSNIVAINRRYFPELLVAFPISEKQPLAWVIKKDETRLAAKLTKWFKEFQKTSRFADLKERYYDHIEIFDYVDIRAFHRRIKNRLPKYQRFFEESGERFNLPWTLLAAKAYQESHWNPNAKSPTGVRGIMMLTLPTAAELEVTNRLDPQQSIMGGSKYIRQLIDRVPRSIPKKNRLPFAIAAYNVGMGHIYDARTLARRQGKDPDSWNGIKSILPQLSQKKYYKTLKYGYARGREPVRYVDRIYNYRDILEQKLMENK